MDRRFRAAINVAGWALIVAAVALAAWLADSGRRREEADRRASLPASGYPEMRWPQWGDDRVMFYDARDGAWVRWGDYRRKRAASGGR